MGFKELTMVTGGISDGSILYEKDGIEEYLACTVAWITFKYTYDFLLPFKLFNFYFVL